MNNNKKFIIIFLLAAAVSLGAAAVKAPSKFRNLKVLPQDISDQKLDSIMHSYNVALGIGCNFCHSPVKNFPDSLDYAIDDNPIKENAREMMRMTILINKNYFQTDKAAQPEYLNVVHCKTCHRGDPYPYPVE